MRTRVVSEVTREKLRICNTGKKLTKKQLQGHQGKNKGRKDTKETCELKRQIALKRPPMSEDVKEKIRQKRKLQFNHNKGRITITNGTQNKLILPTDEIPDGWYLGTWKKGHQTGKIFITGRDDQQVNSTQHYDYRWLETRQDASNESRLTISI